ncbi:MAG: aldolase, partial [Methanomicrobiales archaeon]|nr:aldolase [Methanomicrobiales archaeon]
MGYNITRISIQEKEALAERYVPRVQYELKSDIYGCCIKLLTDRREVRDRWSENLFYMSQNIRSHGRLYVFNDPQEGNNQICYDPKSKTAFLLNFQYYGWIKSL